ncbi:MAG: mannose-1-phosphate guanylyltransferase [Fimbriimonadaceae bacterium]|nr:mannose-1-phosphate guanylyltransferase [Fimbriimonadaceae bacterium]QYK57275.1 MAG: mannose-1-phosphate guanylyltransferase [Fimbriimonadaceae bacterium]
MEPSQGAFRRLAVIMAGGSGERFWPVSTKDRPKQFLRLSNPDRTLLGEAVDRAAAVVGLENVRIATGRHLAKPSQAEHPGLGQGSLLAEPCKRNTTGCLAWVTAHLIANDTTGWAQTSIAVLTADHRIEPTSEFVATVNEALATAESTGGLVTIGIRPDRPATGFGYIETGQTAGSAREVLRFTEKPDKQTAEAFLSRGNYLWNSGMFFWTLAAFMAELEQAQPEIAGKVREMASLIGTGDLPAAEQVFESLPNLSIDYALLEKATRVFVVEPRFTWDDLGSWDALSRSLPQDEEDNVAVGNARYLESSGNVVYIEGANVQVCLLGVSDLVVVVTDDTVMVCPKGRAQDVKRFLTD